MLCPICQKEMWNNMDKKASGEYGAKTPDYKCKDKECKYEFDKVSNQWVASEYVTSVWLPKGTPKEHNYTAKPKEPKKSLLDAFDKVVKPEEVRKEQELVKEVVNEQADRSASIVAQVLCKVKGMAGGYKDNEGVVVPDINEEIYKDYIFFQNRLRND